jgi:hypothetical protein
VDLDETPCVSIFQWEVYIDLNPFPIGQDLVSHVILHDLLDQLTRLFLLPHNYRGLLGIFFQFSKSIIYNLQSYHRESFLIL